MHASFRLLEYELWTRHVLEAVEYVIAKGESETGSSGGVHSAVADVVGLVEQLVHHRHAALAHLEYVAVRGRHRHVNAGGKERT